MSYDSSLIDNLEKRLQIDPVFVVDFSEAFDCFPHLAVEKLRRTGLLSKAFVKLGTVLTFQHHIRHSPKKLP